MPTRDSTARLPEAVVAIPEPACSECARLRAEVDRLLDGRDRLLLDLARERERTAALLLSWPPEVAPAPRALRHRAVDALNDAVKRYVPGVHGSLKAAALLVGRSRK